MISPATAAIQAVQSAGLDSGSLRAEAVSGGCIHHAYRVRSQRLGSQQQGSRQQSWFVKINSADQWPLFDAEADGLQALAATGLIRVPNVVQTAFNDQYAWLILEYLELQGGQADAALGQALARLHQITANHFGWHRDNFLGQTPQPNTPCQDAVTFLREQRLGYQLKLAEEDGLDASTLDAAWRLLERLDDFYSDYQPRPALLHGDLWSGNQAQLSDGTPVLFDPAIHYGDPEADLAMTELFGGFSTAFYTAYRAEAGIDKGYSTRRKLHKLYHMLNHFHLFGQGYRNSVQRLVQELWA